MDRGALVILLHVPFAEAQVPNFSWANRAGGPNSNYGQSLTVDGAGNVYVVGSFFGSASFGSITLTGDTADYVREDAVVLFLFAIGCPLAAGLTNRMSKHMAKKHPVPKEDPAKPLDKQGGSAATGRP